MIKSTGDLEKELNPAVAGDIQAKIIDEVIKQLPQEVDMSASEANNLREEMLRKARLVPKPMSADNLQDYVNKVTHACETCINK